ncbi:MAG: chromate resistance protein [Candidatus Brocadia sinica]|nr:MAG: chromate resistance protein [Candidatus Brocadia sinica]MCK6468647.1 chromate resistance protein [Candidatus Brocadia sinica]NUO04533.1 chromate resistance protein [Candidatus Brocadia sinica]
MSYSLRQNSLAGIARPQERFERYTPEIVHDIDLKDSKYGRKETEGIEQIIRGLKQRQKDDNKLLEKGMEIFDALYQYYTSI